MTYKLEKPSVKVDPHLCKGCGICIEDCPEDVLKFHLKFNAKGYHYAYYTGEGCTGCQICFYACPEPEVISVFRKGYEYTTEAEVK
jgi:NAD-dependent dihydropyrimidine dehydrogenase PreA subunit